MTDYVIMRTTNWWALFQIIMALIMGIVSMAATTLLYSPIFMFYMPFYRELIGTFLFLNFIIWFWIFISKSFDYKPKEERLEVRKERK